VVPTTSLPAIVPAGPVRKTVASVLVAIAALLVAWVALGVHQKRSCALADTPYLGFCPDPSAPDALQLRERLVHNPGEARAWIKLSQATSGAAHSAALRGASVLAPHEPNVLLLVGWEALEREQIDRAIDAFVQLVSLNSHSESAAVLARLLASGNYTSIFESHVDTADRWLPAVLGQLRASRQDSGVALRLVASAMKKRRLKPEIFHSYVATLKGQGRWTEAYALWLTQQRQPAPILSDGSFEQPFANDPFGWESPASAARGGVVVRQRAHPGQGLVLELQFTGRPFTNPVTRQHLSLPPGTYVLRGKYMSSRLRSETGLAWSASCINRAAGEAGRSEPFLDSGNRWKAFEFPLTVPANCGPVAELSLGTYAAFEAAVGLRGEISFDDLSLHIHKK
jgi:hypothetical protein